MITRPKFGVWAIAAACFSVLPLMAQATFSEERAIALWVLRLGGQVMVTGVDSPIADPFKLPSGDFRIVTTCSQLPHALFDRVANGLDAPQRQRLRGIDF